MTQTPVEILQSTRALISSPEHWTQGTNARTAKGTPVSYDDPTATCFCLYGAVCHVAGMGQTLEAWGYLKRLVAQGNSRTYVHEFNDYAQHADILQLLDEAIELATLASPQESKP